MKKSLKHKNMYIFISILSFIGLITGYSYYSYQNNEVKEQIQTKINYKEVLINKTTHTSKKIIEISLIFICSIFIITSNINIFMIFFNSFALGFLINALKMYNFKFKIIYLTIFHIIPYIITIYLIRISFTITKELILSISYKERRNKNKLKNIIYKYLIISIILIIYELLSDIKFNFIKEYLLSILK